MRVRATWLVLALAGCTARALPIPDTSDLGPKRDLASVDLSSFDLAPLDMTRPHYCNGIYGVDRNGTLLFFDPVKLTFTTVAAIACSESTLPFSMALGNDGTAWVEYDDGRLFRVDSEDGSCTPTGFVPGQLGFSSFGMGFAADAPDSTKETLYIEKDGAGLGRIDLTTLQVHLVATLPPGQRAELTGTGAGELWGFFAQASPHMGRFDKTTGALAPDFSFPQLGDLSVDAFAFGFFGGFFYAFLAPNGESTTVVKIDPTTGTTEIVLQNTGVEIVGAGVSTCAPTQ